DRTGADAEVGHARRPQTVEQNQAPVDDDLGLRARDERALVRLQRQPAEAPLAEHVRERLPSLSAVQQRLDALELAVEVGVELRARDAKRMRDEQLGVDARSVDPGGREPSLGLGERLARGHSRLRRRSSAAKASVNSSRPPWSTRSSWCCVSLMRWSVIRLSGKLYVRIFSARS